MERYKICQILTRYSSKPRISCLYILKIKYWRAYILAPKLRAKIKKPPDTRVLLYLYSFPHSVSKSLSTGTYVPTQPHCSDAYQPLKRQTKTAADDVLIFYFYLSKKIRLDFSWIHLKHQVLFSLKNNKKIFMNVVCCSRDWRFKG